MMNTMGTKDYTDLENENPSEKELKDSIIPSLIYKKSKEIPLLKAIVISLLAHPGVIILGWLLIFILSFLGINLLLLEKPKPKVRDLEFVLVNNQDKAPLNKNTRYRADRNSRAGGKHDPKKAVSAPQPVAKKSTPRKAAAAPKPKVVQRRSAPKPQPKKLAPPKPSTSVTPPKVALAKPNTFSFKAPTVKKPSVAAPAGGPVTSAPIGSSSSKPSPMMSSNGSYSSRGNSRSSSGYSTGGGNPGNPGPGNPNGAPGIDAIKEPDFGPYMRDLQRRIKRNWTPPKGNRSKRVVLVFKISKDGRLLSLRVHKSSGVESVDRAAMNAVKITAPFRSLPREYRSSSIDIQFTFDYNVFGVGSRY